MKKFFLLLAAFALFTTTFAASIIRDNSKNANNIFLPIGNNTQISLMDLSKINVKDYEKISGKHLNFFQKISFKAGQKKLRHSITTDGTITNKKLLNIMSDMDATSDFNVGWFFLGFLYGIGVLLSYIISGDKDVKKNRQKWAWIGFGSVLLIALIVILAIARLTY